MSSSFPCKAIWSLLLDFELHFSLPLISVLFCALLSGCDAELGSHLAPSESPLTKLRIGLAKHIGGELLPAFSIGGNGSLRQSDGEEAEVLKLGDCRGKSPRRACGEREASFKGETSRGCKLMLSAALAGETMGGKWFLELPAVQLLVLLDLWALFKALASECACTP